MPNKPTDAGQAALRARDGALRRSARRSADEKAHLEQHGLKRVVSYYPRELGAGAVKKVRRDGEVKAWRRAGRTGDPPLFERKLAADGPATEFVEIDQ